MRTLGDYLEKSDGVESGQPIPEIASGKPKNIAGFPSGSFEDDSDSGAWTVGTESASGEPAGGSATVKRGRGRPPGSGKKSQEKTLPSDLAAVNQKNLAGLITTAHVMLANVASIPELGALTDEDAKEYADHVTEVAKYHLKEINPKAVAVFNLVAFQCGLYICMFKKYRTRLSTEGPRPAVQMQKPSQQTQVPPAKGNGIYTMPPEATGQAKGNVIYTMPPGATGQFEP